LKHRRCNETKKYHPAQQSPHKNEWLPGNENPHGRTSGDEVRLTITSIILRKTPDFSRTSCQHFFSQELHAREGQQRQETRVLRARDVAKLFQVTPQHVDKMAAGGRLPSFRLAGAIRFDPHELANWLRKAQPVTVQPEEGNRWRRSA
jgi:predicted DNA-binding transcriptional regulator AlpA